MAARKRTIPDWLKQVSVKKNEEDISETSPKKKTSSVVVSPKKKVKNVDGGGSNNDTNNSASTSRNVEYIMSPQELEDIAKEILDKLDNS